MGEWLKVALWTFLYEAVMYHLNINSNSRKLIPDLFVRYNLFEKNILKYCKSRNEKTIGN